MSAANLQPDSAVPAAPEPSDDTCEPSRPTQPWHAPPALLDTPSMHEPEFELDAPEGFDFHDTIPAPPWLDEPLDAPEAAVLPAR
jgi:hypothetical protein